MDSANRKLRWGVLGYARIAHTSVIPAIVRSSNSVLHAVASRDEAKLAEARTRFSPAKTYLGYDELLRDPEVDAVYIPLPNSMHREWTIKAANAGKHVLCEKPIGLSAAECRDMIAACERNGVTLMEAFMYRYTDRTRQVQAVLRSGRLGEIKHINATFRFLLGNPASIKLKPELGGGSLYDVGCYPVNFIGMVVDAIAGGGPGSGGQPESVAARQILQGGVDVSFSAVLQYDSGLLAGLHCGINAHKRVFAEITGTLGVLEVPETFFDPAGSLILTIGEDRIEIPVEASDRYRHEVEDFAEAVFAKRAPRFSLTETLRNAEVLDRLFASAAK
jgi:predicted dehydrogenase